MITLITSIIFWIGVYALEAKHDIKSKSDSEGEEKWWDAGMFAVLHIGFGIAMGFILGPWQGIILGIISLMIRVVFHDGFINVFRDEKFCGKFTDDNKHDYWDRLMVYLYSKNIKPCIITIVGLIIPIIVYIVLFII